MRLQPIRALQRIAATRAFPRLRQLATQRYMTTSHEPIAFSKTKAAQTNLNEAMEFIPAGTSQTTAIFLVLGTSILAGLIYTYVLADNSDLTQFFPQNSTEAGPSIEAKAVPAADANPAT